MNLLRVFFPAAMLLILGALASQPAGAARVDDLYSATVTLSAKARDPLNEAFGRALAEVLVKVTAQPEIGREAARAGLFANPGSLVQQYSRLPNNRLLARFDSKAIRAALDSAGLPVWGETRPLVGIWLAVDSGGGRRLIVADGNDGAPGAQSELDAVRARIAGSASRRGLPVVLPLVDARDLAIVNFADIWGDFRGPVIEASQRYGAETVLIGRARSLNVGDDRTRWTLNVRGEQITWTGDIASGPAKAAEYLGQRLATFADSAGTLRVLVRDVDSLEKYGRLRAYFGSLGIVERATIGRVNGDEVEFDLVVRGDSRRLEQELDRSKVLQPASAEAVEPGRLPDLVYTWATDS